MAGSGKGKEPAAAPASTPLPSSSREVGNYALGQELGSGAYGRVFKGASRKTGQVVAVKEARRRAEGIKEWHLMSKVAGHPHVVQAIALEERRTHVFYVLEFAAGGDLLSYATRRGFRLPEEKVQAITRQIVAALLHINARGVAHFDIKPGNVLFKDAEHSHVLLADFGAAEVLGKPDRLFTRPAGTVPYMAPEVLRCCPGAEDAAECPRRRGFSKLADNWSLGALVYHLLHGHLPFAVHEDELSAPTQYARAQLEAILARPSLFAEDTQQSRCSKEARDFISRLLQVNPARRMTLEEALEHPWLESARAGKHGLDDPAGGSSSAQGGKRPRLG
ncbi:kinase-like domain-containing protein [Syncephalis pseudoplumigaleata]|uniref:Kinase-like domain-containing protein n=1 Tax=Syncephalis pseudoplumigaleata TaxID=1712513 RepID=A0A4V1J0S9_9FUNG|nr:kinase-like domain-containing protein [Syncephalis pseudoplumigaleata]|eukprot:RKP22619.1 kinase-like domain-containing protein [Syncephalis pseudoplumigaleata]